MPIRFHLDEHISAQVAAGLRRRGALDDGGVAAHTGAGPEDEAVTPDGRYLYTLNAVDQSISAFRVALDGGLTHLRDRSGLPRGAAGLVAR